MTRTEDGDADATIEYAVVLGVPCRGRQGGDRRRLDAVPIAYALGESGSRLLELTLAEDANMSIGDRLVVSLVADSELIQPVEELSYGDFSSTATAEVDYIVEDIVEADGRRFVDSYNDAQPITLRLYQLNSLPGIGKRFRDKILESQKRQGLFESLEDLEARVLGLHHPKEVIVERVLDEPHDNGVKYKTLVGRDGQ